MIGRRIAVAVATLLGILVLGGTALALADQHTGCRSQPDVGPVVDPRTLPVVKNFDPCTDRITMTDNALKRTGGPYISSSEAERRTVGPYVQPTKVRSYFVTEAKAQELIGEPGYSTDIYPDREEWLVVAQAPDQGPMPSLPAGVKPWPRRWFYVILDATTGRVLSMGGNGPNDGDWPASPPAD